MTIRDVPAQEVSHARWPKLTAGDFGAAFKDVDLVAEECTHQIVEGGRLTRSLLGVDQPRSPRTDCG
ncbi:MAG: hypothetical protein ACRD0S_04380 [Acidimicrobiales bacterium]